MSSSENTNRADDEAIQRTVEALRARNIEAVVANSGDEAKKKLLEMIPEGAEIFDNTSETLDSIGFTDYINKNPRYTNLRDAIDAETDVAKQREMRRRSSVVEYSIGSVQAVAETGEVVVASGSGSNLGSYVYGAKNVIWVVGTQKICPSLSDAVARARGYTLERHDQMLEARGRGPGPIGKLVIFENESIQGRVRMILIKESLGW